MNCDEVRECLAAYQEPSEASRDVSVKRHLVSCPDCRAELAQYRALGLRLTRLAEEPMDPPSWLLPTLIDQARSRGTLRRRAAQLADRRVALAGGVIMAGVAGTLAIRARRRRQRHTLRRRLRAAAA